MPDRPAVPGEVLGERWTPRQADFDRFAEVSGDDNPIHVDPDFSARTRFGRTVSHGMLLYTRLWGLLRRRFPDTVQLEQDLMFPNPAFADEELDLEARVEAVFEDGTKEIGLTVRRLADAEPVLTGRTRLGPGES